jgi:dipeptidyl aminopeptidase/acylaminoacyl peptidase
MTRPLTPEDLVYGYEPAADPQLSPDGTRVLYAVASTDRASGKSSSQLWLAAAGTDEARRITWGGERNRGGRWSPATVGARSGGLTIAFVSDRVKQSGIFLLPADGAGEARELTRHGGDAGELAWSPDGARIAYVAHVDPERPDGEEPPAGRAPRPRVTRRIDYKRDNRGYLGDARRQLFVVDVATGQRRQVTESALDRAHPQWSPDGRWLAVQLQTSAVTSRLELIGVDSGEVRLVGPAEGVVTTWAWSPDGDRLLLSHEPRRTGQPDYYLYRLADGSLTPVTEALDVLPNGGFPGLVAPAQPVWLDERRVLVSAASAAASGLYRLDVASGRLELVHRAPAARSGLSVDADRRLVAQGHAGPDALGEVVLHDLASGEEMAVTRRSADLFGEAPPPGWELLAVERGGLTIEALLLKPPGFDPSRRYPVVLDVHGGPQAFHPYGFSPVQLCLATNGYLVVAPNPRGSTSYGRDFTVRVREDWGGEDYLDLLAVVDAVVARPYADSERTGIFGYSYGGYMTAWAIGQTDRFRAAVCGAPCFNLVSMYGTSDIGSGFGADEQWGGEPHQNLDWYLARSPSSHAHKAKTPTLLIHGEADERCPIGQSEEMFTALVRAGCEVEYVRYPGGSHLFMRVGPPEHRADVLGRVLGWFDRHLAPRPAGERLVSARA